MGLNHNFIIYISKITIALMASLCTTKAISAETKNCDGGGYCADSTSEISLTILYRAGEYEIDKEFSGNSERITIFFSRLDSISRIPSLKLQRKVFITSSASPEGSTLRNALLSQNRARSAESLFLRKAPEKAEIITNSIGEDWQMLAELIKESKLEPTGRAVRIIENTPTYIIKGGKIVGGRKQSVMNLQGGKVWWILFDKLFPMLRRATITVRYTQDQPLLEVQSPLPVPLVEMQQSGEIAAVIPALPQRVIESKIGNKISIEPQPRKPLFALKTNLLYDAATLINLGIEIPLGERFSIAADATFPWWQSRKNDITIQMLAGTVEGRYWFGKREERLPMTGFFAGVFAGGGYFDFQLGKLSDTKGVQGDIFFMGGLSAGYAHTISKRLRMEYSLGLGYMLCEWRKYETAKDTRFGDIKVFPYPWEVKRTSALFPLKASVSLVWMLDSKKGTAEKGGAK